MIKDFYISLELTNQIVLLGIVLYGVLFGTSNIILKIRALFGNRRISQSNHGNILDNIWIISIIYFLYEVL